MVCAQGLKCVVKDGRVAALLQSLQQFRYRPRGLIADARQMGNSKEVEWCFRGVYRIISSILESAAATSAGPRRENWARVLRRLPTNIEIPFRAAPTAGSSEKSS